MPYPPLGFLDTLYSKFMSNFFEQYLVKSIADRVRVRFGLGITLVQWGRVWVRANPSSIPTRCCGGSDAGSNGASEMWEHRAVGT